jgi:hypothetical protein
MAAIASQNTTHTPEIAIQTRSIDCRHSKPAAVTEVSDILYPQTVSEEVRSST